MMRELTVSLGKRSYPIMIQNGLLQNCAVQLNKVCPAPRRVILVTDDTVAALYEATVTEALQAGGYAVKAVRLAPGEGSKTLESIARLYTEAFAFSMTRSDVVVALGGGVVGDVAGFFAATLFRGVPFVQIPTTLLAQVDSSVGGKTGVNVPEGKNLVGSFYQPRLVLIDPTVLGSLTDSDFADGMAEVIKYGCICDAELFRQLSQAGSRAAMDAILPAVIATCCDAKRKVVEADELDTGSRMLLNFGHTMGHVIEKGYGFKTYTHGKAVAIGMVLAARLGERTGKTEAGTAEKIEAILRQFHLPTEAALPDGWDTTMLLDKKMQNGLLHCVLLHKIGEGFVEKTKAEAFIQAIQALSKP